MHKFLLLLLLCPTSVSVQMNVPYVGTLRDNEMQKREQKKARYGERVITGSVLLSKRGFAFLFFRFLGFTTGEEQRCQHSSAAQQSVSTKNL